MADYTWLRPEIEAEIKFTEWTAGARLRHAQFVTPREL
jgi:ATP-dependent DNA ligase